MDLQAAILQLTTAWTPIKDNWSAYHVRFLGLRTESESLLYALDVRGMFEAPATFGEYTRLTSEDILIAESFVDETGFVTLMDTLVRKDGVNVSNQVLGLSLLGPMQTSLELQEARLPYWVGESERNNTVRSIMLVCTGSQPQDVAVRFDRAAREFGYTSDEDLLTAELGFRFARSHQPTIRIWLPNGLQVEESSLGDLRDLTVRCRV